MHPLLRLGLLVCTPVLGAFVVVIWHYYRRWRDNPALTGATSTSVSPPAAVEPKAEQPIRADLPKNLKEVKAILVSYMHAARSQ